MDAGMGNPAELRAAIWARIEQAAVEQDASPVLEPDALRESRQLEEGLSADAAALESRLALGWLHWYRFVVFRPREDGRNDLSAAIRMFTLCFVADMQPLPEGLIPVLAEAAIPLAEDALFRNASEVGADDLLDIISLCQRILEALDANHPGRLAALLTLNRALFRRFGLTNQLDDLDASIRVGEAALSLMPANHPGRPAVLSILGLALLIRAQRTGRRSDLDAGIGMGQQAVGLMPVDDPARGAFLVNLSQAFQARFDQVHQLADLSAGVEAGAEAVSLMNTGDPARGTALINLSHAFQTQFAQTGHLSDLDAGIGMGQEAVGMMNTGDPARGTALANLSSAFQTRFAQTGQLSDLAACIERGEEAVFLMPADDPARGTALASLSHAFQARFDRVHQLGDLDAAVEAGVEAVRVLPADHPDRTAVAAEQDHLARLRAQYASRLLVSTGFASPSDPYQSMDPNNTLQIRRAYLYWFEVSGTSASDAIDSPEHREIPIEPQGSDTPLTVALFGFPGQIETFAEKDVGELIIAPDGLSRVAQQPAPDLQWAVDGGRLAFPVRMPDEPGRYRLRVSLYCRQTLLQSRLVEAEVTAEPQHSEQALLSTVNFNICNALNPALLTTIRPLRLSVLLNDNENGTHGFRFMGENNLKGDAVLDGQQLQDLLDRARQTYRRAAWNDEDEWQPEWDQDLDRYVYREFPGQQRLCADLIRMARAGYRLWARLAVQLSASLVPQLPSGQAPQRSLREVMRHGPGFVEFASKRSARMVVPASILYDYPLDTNKDLQVCADALSAILGHDDLAAHPCFTGDCPSYHNPTVVCPGGFWGFRHGIGLPQSRGERVDGQAEGEADTVLVDSWPEIRHTEKPGFIIGVADDLRGDHVTQILELGDSQSRIEGQRDKLLADLRSTDFRAHIEPFSS